MQAGLIQHHACRDLDSQAGQEQLQVRWRLGLARGLPEHRPLICRAPGRTPDPNLSLHPATGPQAAGKPSSAPVTTGGATTGVCLCTVMSLTCHAVLGKYVVLSFCYISSCLICMCYGCADRKGKLPAGEAHRSSRGASTMRTACGTCSRPSLGFWTTTL